MLILVYTNYQLHLVQFSTCPRCNVLPKYRNGWANLVFGLHELLRIDGMTQFPREHTFYKQHSKMVVHNRD